MNVRMIAGLGIAGAGAILLTRWATSSASGAALNGSGTEQDEGLVVVASCDKETNGTLCGPPGTGKFCIADECVTNRCGDTRVMAQEDCDDGNHRAGDGCGLSCKWEAPASTCGNGSVDPSEACDDGNADNADGCTARCTLARCGDGLVGPGETCDDGNLDDTDPCTASCLPTPPEQMRAARGGSQGIRLPDGTYAPAGSTAAVAGVVGAANGGRAGANGMGAGSNSGAPGSAPLAGSSASLNSKGAAAGIAGGTSNSASAAAAATMASAGTDACKMCREQHCRSYGGGDVVAGCLETVQAEIVPNAGDPTFLQDCADVVACARSHGCAYNPTTEAAGCYCGAISVDECNAKGPAKDAPCKEEWLVATRSRVHEEVIVRMSDTTFPSGWAFHLLQCDLRHCKDVCTSPLD